jgi:hypothetical protein
MDLSIAMSSVKRARTARCRRVMRKSQGACQADVSFKPLAVPAILAGRGATQPIAPNLNPIPLVAVPIPWAASTDAGAGLMLNF